MTKNSQFSLEYLQNLCSFFIVFVHCHICFDVIIFLTEQQCQRPITVGFSKSSDVYYFTYLFKGPKPDRTSEGQALSEARKHLKEETQLRLVNCAFMSSWFSNMLKYPIQGFYIIDQGNISSSLTNFMDPVNFFLILLTHIPYSVSSVLVLSILNNQWTFANLHF